MIVVMKTTATEGQILAVQKRIREMGFKDHLSRGAERTVIGVLGPVYAELQDEFSALAGVDSVVRITKPFKAEGPMPNMVGEVSVSPYNAGALTIPANLSGYPAVSIPVGLSASGLPIGLQAYARRHEDALLLDLAQIMEQVHPWPKVVPNAPV